MESVLLWSEFCRSAKHFAKARLCHLLLSLVEGLFSILQNSFSPCQQQYLLEGRMTWRKIGSVFTLVLEIPLTSLSNVCCTKLLCCLSESLVLLICICSAYLGVLSAPLKMVPDNLHLRSYQLLLPVSSSFWACVNMTNGDAEVSPWDKHYTTERTHICYGQQPHSCSSPSTIDFRHEGNREIAKTVTLCLYKYIPSAYFSHVSSP